MLDRPGVFKLLMGQRKLATFLGRRPTVLMLCFDSTLLKQLKVGPKEGKKSTNIRFCLGTSSLSGALRANTSLYGVITQKTMT
jgi:hypothetical protein